MFGVAANAYETARDTGSTLEGVMDGLSEEMIINAMEATFIPTFWDLFAGLAKPDQFGERGLTRTMESLANLIVPRPVQDIAKIIDPTYRESSLPQQQDE